MTRTTDENVTESPVSEDTQQYYINSVMRSVEHIRRKSFRRLILLKFIIEYEAHERHGPAWEEWLEQKEDSVNAKPTNFLYALDVALVREMEPSGREFCTEEDVAFLYDVSDETLREYIRTIQAVLD